MTPIYLCGPHGAGKTTLAERLRDTCSDVLIADLKTTTPKFHTTPFERIMLKLGQRAIENYETAELAAANPNRIVIGNRCVYDARAYAEVYRKLDWITSTQYDKLRAVEQMFTEQQPYAIILNPGYDTVRQRLTSRWSTEEKKWRESDESYARAACDAYLQFRGVERIHYIEDNGVEDCLLEKMQALAQHV